MYSMIEEGSVKAYVHTAEKISKELPVFYNPAMKFNRDISVLLLKQFPPMSLCDLMAASGIRAVRFAKELKFKSLTANDHDKESMKLIKKNMKLNKVSFTVENKDANRLLLESKGFDYIDVDPFGSPNPFLDMAVKKISRGGLLAVTATDTAALTGTYPKSTLRKYWAISKKNELMHETGLRILIRKVQLVAAQYDKAMVPVFSFFKDHYFRAFFQCAKGKEEVDRIVKEHGMLNGAGPLWLGQLFDMGLTAKMLKSCKGMNDKKLEKFMKIVNDESKIKTAGFFDIHAIVEREGIKHIRKKEEVVKEARKAGFKCSETHFSGTGIRSDISYERLLRILKQ